MPIARVSALAAAAALIAGPALAADMPMIEPPVATTAIQEGWLVTLKGTGVVQPKFEGAAKYGVSGYPGLSIRRPGQPWKFGAPDDGFGFALIDTPWFQAGPVGRIRSERNSSDVRKFRGMDDVNWGIEPGVFVEVYPLDVFRVRGEFRRGVYGHHGFVGNIAADYIQRFDNITVSIGPRTEFGSGRFMNTYFGVDLDESIANGRVGTYKAGGGFKSVGAAAAITYDWDENWSTTAFGGYDRLVGDAAKSPVAKTLGTKNAFTAGLGLAYTFGVNW